eukprot:7484135-Pyramimonas_sp.AAC.1
MIDGMLTHEIKRLNLSRPLRVTGVGAGAAACRTPGPYIIACGYRGNPAGKPAMAKLDTCSANVAERSGELLPAFLGPKNMANMRAILILQTSDGMVIPGAEMNRLLLGKGA